MARFEKVSRFIDTDITMPIRKTEFSAGYDMIAAEDIVIPSIITWQREMCEECADIFTIDHDNFEWRAMTLDEMSTLTKRLGSRPTLVSTGMKCKLDPGTYLELSVRSSSPLKYWLILANGVGIIDADYYNNPDNEGEIFFQLINLSPYDIKIQKGEAIGQGIIKSYLTTEDDAAAGARIGGFGSTNA